jgi:hypothetical protein
LHTPDGHVDFAGNVQPLADHPQLLEQPLQFQLRGQGKSPFQIEGTLAFQSSTPVQSNSCRRRLPPRSSALPRPC